MQNSQIVTGINGINIDTLCKQARNAFNIPAVSIRYDTRKFFLFS